VVWVAVFQSKLLFASLGGVLKMDVVSFFRTVSIANYCVCVEGNNPNALWFEMRS